MSYDGGHMASKKSTFYADRDTCHGRGRLRGRGVQRAVTRVPGIFPANTATEAPTEEADEEPQNILVMAADGGQPAAGGERAASGERAAGGSPRWHPSSVSHL